MGCLRGLLWMIGVIFVIGVIGTMFGQRIGTTPPSAAVSSGTVPAADVAPEASGTDIKPAEAAKPTPKPAEPFYDPKPISPWRVSTSTSKVDDSTSVYLTVQSDNLIDKRFGGSGRATFTIRCVENTTALTFEFAENFMADIQGYGDITYRIDKQKAKRRGFRESTDNMVLGLWNGGSAIPFVKSLFGAERLYVQAVPFNESPVEAEFQVRQLEDSIAPLRKACKW